MFITRLKKLYIGEFGEFREYKILYSPSSNLIIDGTLLSPFAEDIGTNASVSISSSNHLKRLDYYVGVLGNKKKVPEYERLKQIKVISKVKSLYQLGRI